MILLVELGSSNLNFSAEDTMHLFGRLSTQAGPTRYSSDDLRDVHIVFRDESFCRRLTDQNEKRLYTIKSNWRETNCMELLLTLTLRLYELSDGTTRQPAIRILELARSATLDWILHLRDDIRNAADATTAMRVANCGFWAALLCRRTFTTFRGLSDVMNAADLSSLI
jgi:hypothetical protein